MEKVPLRPCLCISSPNAQPRHWLLEFHSLVPHSLTASWSCSSFDGCGLRWAWFHPLLGARYKTGEVILALTHHICVSSQRRRLPAGSGIVYHLHLQKVLLLRTCGILSGLSLLAPTWAPQQASTGQCFPAVPCSNASASDQLS